MKTCIAALLLMISGCNGQVQIGGHDNRVPARITILEEQGFGTHVVKLVSIDGKEYVVNGDGGIIEHVK